MKTNFQNTISLFAALGIGCFHLGINVYVPALPDVAQDFGVHRDIVQLSVAAFLIGSAFASLIYGALSDQLGRRPILMVGLSIFLVTTIICMFALNIETLIVMRVFQGLGAGCISVNCLSMVQEQYEIKKASAILSWIGVVREFVIALAPILGGYLVVAFGWRATFFVVAVSIAGLLTFGKLKLFETAPRKKTDRISAKNILKDYQSILKNAHFIKYISIFPLLLCGLWSYITVAPFYFISHLNIPTEHFGYYIAPAAIMYSIGSVLTPKFIHKYGLNQTISIGLYLCLSAGIGHILAHFLVPGLAVLIVAIQSFYVMGLALIFAPSINKAVEPFKMRRATANSLGSMVRQGCAGLGGVAGSFFNDAHMMSVALFLTFLSGLAIFIFRVVKASD